MSLSSVSEELRQFGAAGDLLAAPSQVSQQSRSNVELVIERITSGLRVIHLERLLVLHVGKYFAARAFVSGCPGPSEHIRRSSF
jgi:hypothetical protein